MWVDYDEELANDWSPVRILRCALAMRLRPFGVARHALGVCVCVRARAHARARVCTERDGRGREGGRERES
jgi:hypothetical protein